MTQLTFPWLGSRSFALAWLVGAALVFAWSSFRPARYGKLGDPEARGLAAPRAWLLMELPALLMPVVALATGAALGPACLWALHYARRALVYPFRLRGARPVPWAVALAGAGFSTVNALANGAALVGAASRPLALVVGAGLFLVGEGINAGADAELLRLRRRGGYVVPRGGLFEHVSAPHYLGELIAWIGFAIAAGTWAAVAFVAWTAANLVPRALATHRWYRARFTDYPRRRRALVPGLLVVALFASGQARADEGWRVDRHERGITLARRFVGGAAYAEHRVEATLLVSADVVADALWRRVERAELPGLKRREVLSRGLDRIVAYDQIKAPVVSDRDYTVVIERAREGDARIVRFRSDNLLGPSETHAHVRMPQIRATWTVTPAGAGARVALVTYSEPGGRVPALLVRGAQARRAFDDMARLCAELGCEGAR